ncbi:hypothetical protein QBC37DRAFT_459408 [Rhypophila decipiens]|uniref:Uncharacterized protein n=1 Tax=Rhypophila decipiens TaxID=261697 RepID=A0AAN6Y9N4_9PEZI|nr:hypothetical protein QBC37DRAFT_459408 [Rhypophila decipiens]
MASQEGDVGSSSSASSGLSHIHILQGCSFPSRQDWIGMLALNCLHVAGGGKLTLGSCGSPTVFKVLSDRCMENSDKISVPTVITVALLTDPNVVLGLESSVRPPGSGVYFVKDENSRKSRNLRHTWALDDRELYEHASTFEIDSGLWSACRESKAVIQEVYRKRGLHPFIIPSRNKQSNLIQSVTGEPIVSFVKHDTPELDHPKELESWTETPLFTILPRADLGICKIELWPSGCPKLPQSMHPFYSTSPAYGLVVPEYLQEMWKHLRFLALDLPPELWRLYRPSQGKGFPTSPIETLMVEILGMPYPHLYPHLETIFIIDWELKTRPEVEDFARLPIKFTGNGVRFVAYQYVGKAKEAHELPAVEIRGSSQAVK